MEGTMVRQSSLGITSFVLALLFTLFTFAVFIVAEVFMKATESGMPEGSAQFIVLGFLAKFGVVGCLIGLGLGIAGILDKNRRKSFSVLGIVINAALIAAILKVLILGAGL